MVRESSKEAFKKIDISHSQRNILKLIKSENTPFCQRRILELARLKINRYLEICSITGRVNELIELGYLKEVGRMENKYSGIRTTHYILTEKGKDAIKYIK